MDMVQNKQGSCSKNITRFVHKYWPCDTMDGLKALMAEKAGWCSGCDSRLSFASTRTSYEFVHMIASISLESSMRRLVISSIFV